MQLKRQKGLGGGAGRGRRHDERSPEQAFTYLGRLALRPWRPALALPNPCPRFDLMRVARISRHHPLTRLVGRGAGAGRVC